MPSSPPSTDPVGQPITLLLEAFGAHAEALCFPEVDHATLLADATEVREAATEVERCELALSRARSTLTERREALTIRAARGIAYARVYAQDDPDLQQTLAAIDLGPRRRASTKRTSTKAPRQTGRGRRARIVNNDDTISELPFAADAPAALERVDVA
jgi:hypothetical protein